MAAVGFEEFSVPPGSELALPPLFGGNILESELETEVEFADGGIPEEEEEEDMLRQQELTRHKCQVLAQHCKELEQVNERMLNRLHQVQRITLRLKQERRPPLWPTGPCVMLLDSTRPPSRQPGKTPPPLAPMLPGRRPAVSPRRRTGIPSHHHRCAMLAGRNRHCTPACVHPAGAMRPPTNLRSTWALGTGGCGVPSGRSDRGGDGWRGGIPWRR
ncbi:TCF3 fusion partner-like [Crotalus adamanteus]|uniref:TCF3 fusion partner-like n=1 Tax=Crotalus adamanteus TaxID=8729 RepID=A0AAW1B1R7_CROAD